MECAGKLIAEKGFAAVTSKEICEKAGVNLAAVNYHFGSRNGMYLALLEQVHQYVIPLERLQALERSGLTPREKVEACIGFLVENAFRKRDWQMGVWVREMMNPSPLLREFVNEAGLPKFSIIVKIFSEYTGYGENDHRLYSAMVTLAAPFAMMVLGQYHPVTGEIPVHFPRERLAEDLKSLALANLENLKKQ